MKYVITDQNEAGVQNGGFHFEIANKLKGRVERAGHCKRNDDGTYEVFGESIGYGIHAQPEDAKLLETLVQPSDFL